MQQGFVAVLATSWERPLCLPPFWHCSFCLCHLVPFLFLISRGLNAIKLIGFQGIFPAYFSLASWVQEGVSFMLAALWFSLLETHFLQVGAGTWPKLYRLKVLIWEQTPHMQNKAKLTVRLQYYLLVVCGSTLTHINSWKFLCLNCLKCFSHNTRLFAELYFLTLLCIEASF